MASYIRLWKPVAYHPGLFMLPTAGLQQTTSSDIAYKQAAETHFGKSRPMQLQQWLLAKPWTCAAHMFGG